MISLRPIELSDGDLLYRIYASTRLEELAVLDWDDAARASFLAMQFNAQHTYYQQTFPHAAYSIILGDDTPIGRLYLDRSPDDLHIIDIALLPEYRNQGVGTALLRNILADGDSQNLPVRIYVEHNNPALHLYTRLGFRQVAEQGLYSLMERTPHVHG